MVPLGTCSCCYYETVPISIERRVQGARNLLNLILWASSCDFRRNGPALSGNMSVRGWQAFVIAERCPRAMRDGTWCVSGRGRDSPCSSRESRNREALAPYHPPPFDLRSRLNVSFLARGTDPTSGKAKLFSQALSSLQTSFENALPSGSFVM